MHAQPMTLDQKLAVKIRKFDGSDADYAGIVAVDNEVWPDFQTNIELWKHWDSTREDKYRFQRWIVEADGRIVGFGAYGDRSWAYTPGQYFLALSVLPDDEDQGYGSALYNHFLFEIEGMEPDVIQITSYTREDKPRGIRFLEDRGYVQTMRFNRSQLRITEFDPAPFMPAVERVRESSIEITTLAQLMERDPDWMRKLYDLEWELEQDVPYHDDFTQISFANFEKRMTDNPSLLPEGWFIAVDGDRWVGMSGLWLNPGNDKRLETGLTGVSRDYRRRGLATAMKVAAIGYARSNGIEEVETDNEENNPMYQINVRLGYQPLPASLDFVKKYE